MLNPKGFWRVDKDKDPELRHTVLTLVAFHDLEEKIRAAGGGREKGIEAFLAQNHGEGWMLPETLRLADYGLGHDERAKHPQPVASRLGPRFYDWQLTQPADESWRECHLHARNLLGKTGYLDLLGDILRDTAPEEWSDRLRLAFELGESAGSLIQVCARGSGPPDAREWPRRRTATKALFHERSLPYDARIETKLLVCVLKFSGYPTPEDTILAALASFDRPTVVTAICGFAPTLRSSDRTTWLETAESHLTATELARLRDALDGNPALTDRAADSPSSPYSKHENGEFLF